MENQMSGWRDYSAFRIALYIFIGLLLVHESQLLLHVAEVSTDLADSKAEASNFRAERGWWTLYGLHFYPRKDGREWVINWPKPNAKQLELRMLGVKKEKRRKVNEMVPR